MRILTIRQADILDAPAIAGLLAELNYPPENVATVYTIMSRLNSENDRLLLAERNEQVIGALCIHIMPVFHAPEMMGKITGLIVTQSARGQGVGKALLSAAATFARRHDAKRIEVISGNHRVAAHQFYLKQNYRQTAQSRFLLQI